MTSRLVTKKKKNFDIKTGDGGLLILIIFGDVKMHISVWKKIKIATQFEAMGWRGNFK